jgi:hypothetical protein
MDEFELELPILPGQSGVMRIDALVDRQKFVSEVAFTVSNFLQMRLVCRGETRVAQISALVTSPAVLRFTGVAFSGEDGEEIKAVPIGIPLVVGKVKSSALFIVEKVPDSAVIFAQQEGLQPFSLHLNVDKLADDAFAEREPEPATPQTIVVPVNCTF